MQIEQLGLHDILAAEHEQLTGKTRGAFGGKINCLNGVEHLRRQGQPGEQRAGMSLDDREHVIEVVRDAGGELADGLHLLRLAQLFLQIQPFGGVGDVAMHDVAWQNGMKRPRERAPGDFGFQTHLALSGGETFLDDAVNVRWQYFNRMTFEHGGRQLLRRLVVIGDGAIDVQFHRRIGIQLDKGGEFLQFGIGPFALDGQADGGGGGLEKLDFIRIKFSPVRAVNAQHSKRPVVSGNGDRDAADHAMFDQKRRRGASRFGLQIGDDNGFAGTQSRGNR